MEIQPGNCMTKSKRPYLRTPRHQSPRPSDDDIGEGRYSFSGWQGREARLGRAVSDKSAQMPDRLCACEGAAGILGLSGRIIYKRFAKQFVGWSIPLILIGRTAVVDKSSQIIAALPRP